MFDYYSDIHFKIARLISSQQKNELSDVLISNSLAQLGLDLLDLVNLILKVEKMFHLEIPDDVAIDSLKDLVDYVYQKTFLSIAS